MVNKITAFSLVEVIVAAVIFTISIAAIFAAMGSLAGRPVAGSVKDIHGVLYGQMFLESLRAEVVSNNWMVPTGPLKPGAGYSLPTYAAFPGYNGTYDVVDLDGVREVTLHITTP